jgi:hypothetical protein
VLARGVAEGTFRFWEPANERARVLLGALEGAMLVARSYGDAHRFQMAAAYVLADLGASVQQRRTSQPAAGRSPRRIRRRIRAPR